MYLTVEMMVALIVCLWEVKTVFSGKGRWRLRIMLILAGCASVFAGLAWLQYDHWYGLDPIHATAFAVILWIPPVLMAMYQAIQYLMGHKPKDQK